MIFKFFIPFLIFHSLNAYDADLVSNLPGLKGKLNFKQYSGYLDVSSTRHFHYWFMESQNDPANDPVILWLNGGPGCSSLDGLLSENGPFHVNDDGKTLYTNPYSWNKLANVIYLESPAGVGYSFDDKHNYRTGDDEVAANNYQALGEFFKKFPQYSKNDFYVTGESYGGIYVPTLSLKILQSSTPKINLKGMAVGNGLSSRNLNDESLVFFAYYHGLIGEKLWKSLSQNCCQNNVSRENCNFGNPKTDECLMDVGDVMQTVYNIGLNSYALYLNCAGRHMESYEKAMSHVFRNVSKRLEKYHKKGLLKHGMPKLHTVPPCINSTAQHNYLNDQAVREAIHIPSKLPAWTVCSDVLHYEEKYNDMLSTYHSIFKYPGFRVLIYNGDTDMACNFLGDQWFVEVLNRDILKKHAAWYVDDQVAGFSKTFDRLTYTTIKGAGHMVPQWAPKFAYRMFENFIMNKPFN